MSRCAITNPRTLKRLSARLGRPVVKALTRGGTDHRVDVRDANGEGWSIYTDDTIERCPFFDEQKAERT